ncbi:MAG: twin-arginine translocase TatA/TatE family subunit [Lachnospiraceae bacterium]|nr:twin-arginine translocase TatA/TatE family subunit [Lachnospiraceae bacterium]
MKIGTTELLVILAIVIVIFGPTQLPKLSRMFGKSVKNFRDSVSDSDDKVSDSSDAADK